MEKKTIKILGYLICVMFICSLAFADEPPSWRPFNVKSLDKSFIAKIDTADERAGINPWERNYTISVYEKATNKLIWKCDYEHNGYPEGILSDDGSTFAYVSFWYYKDDPVVLIYHNGKMTISLDGKSFGIKPSKLVSTVSHELWLSQDGTPYKFASTNSVPLALEIKTIDNKKHAIDVKSDISDAWSSKEIVGYTYKLIDDKSYESLAFDDNGMVALTAGQKGGPLMSPLWFWKIDDKGTLIISDSDGKERIVLNLVEIKNNKITVLNNNKTLVYKRSRN